MPSDSAPLAIATDEDAPPGVGVVDGVLDGEEGDEYPLQPIADIMRAATATKRNDDITSSENINAEHRIVPASYDAESVRAVSGYFPQLIDAVGLSESERSPTCFESVEVSTRLMKPTAGELE